MSFKSSLFIFAFSFALFNTTPASAGIEEYDPFDEVPCIGGGEQAFCVQEIPGQYQATNNLLESVSAFGVTNIVTSPTNVGRPDWSSFSITSTDWDSGYEFMFYREAVLTTDFGTYADLFGTDPVVNFYYISTGSTFQWTLAPGDTDSSFYFNADEVSDVTAFGASANVLHTTVSSVAAVPEPETYAMLLAGLGMLGFAKRRQQS